MRLPRLQLFEFGDLAFLGDAVPDTIVEALGRTQRWGRMLRGLAVPLGAFLQTAGVREVLDLGSGAGEPAALLTAELRRAGMAPPRVIMTDLRARPRVWARVARRDPALAYHPLPVDATAIPEALSAGRARTLINILHHLPPDTARAVLADAVRARAPVFVSEAFGRNPLRFLSFAPVGIPALLANPVLTPERTLGKAAFAWGLTPLALAVCAWDGVVSTLRVYEEDELRAMALAAGEGYRWTFGRWRYPPGGLGWYLQGVPDPGCRPSHWSRAPLV